MAKLTATEKKARDMVGNEPNFAALNYQSTGFAGDYAKALNWVHYEVSEDELTTELEQFLVQRKLEDLVSYMGSLDGVTSVLLGKIAYCVNRGAELSNNSVIRIRTALERVRDAQVVVDIKQQGLFEEIETTSASRMNEIYKGCYSLIDNLRAQVCAGKVELKDVHDQVSKILDIKGAKAQVRKRLVEHYTQSVREALADKTIKTWVKPLQEVLRTLGGDVAAVRERAKKVEAKVKAVEARAKVKVKAEKATKATKPVKGTKVKPAKVKETKVIMIKRKPKLAQGAPTVASQVRDLIRVNKVSVDEAGMVELVCGKLGLSKDRGRSVVKAFWNKMGVA